MNDGLAAAAKVFAQRDNLGDEAVQYAIEVKLAAADIALVPEAGQRAPSGP